MDKLYKAAFTAIGTIIGAGVLGLPTAISEAGFLIGLTDLLIIGGIMTLTTLIIGEICLRTKDAHQIPGLVGKYIGKKTEGLVTLLAVFSMYGALIAYTEGNGKILSLLLGVDPIIGKLMFFIPFSAIIYFGVKGVEESETKLVLIMIFSILILSFASLFYFNPNNLFVVNFSEVFMPIGVIVFAYSGMFAVPQMKEILWMEKSKMKKSILLGMFIPLVLYLFFTFTCIGALGKTSADIITVALANEFGIFFLVFGYAFTFFAMGTGFIALGNATREVYCQDLNCNKNLSFILAVSPALISLLGAATFVDILSITGSLFMIPLLIIVLYLYCKAKRIGERKPEYELNLPSWVLVIIGAFLFLAMIIATWQSLPGWLISLI